MGDGFSSINSNRPSAPVGSKHSQGLPGEEKNKLLKVTTAFFRSANKRVVHPKSDTSPKRRFTSTSDAFTDVGNVSHRADSNKSNTLKSKRESGGVQKMSVWSRLMKIFFKASHKSRKVQPMSLTPDRTGGGRSSHSELKRTTKGSVVDQYSPSHSDVRTCNSRGFDSEDSDFGASGAMHTTTNSSSARTSPLFLSTFTDSDSDGSAYESRRHTLGIEDTQFLEVDFSNRPPQIPSSKRANVSAAGPVAGARVAESKLERVVRPDELKRLKPKEIKNTAAFWIHVFESRKPEEMNFIEKWSKENETFLSECEFKFFSVPKAEEKDWTK